MQKDEGYVYPPLEDDRYAIRLIEVIGLDDQGYLNISVRSAVIQRGSYIALSYVWGPSPAVYRIKLNGRIVLVRQSLWSFLTTCNLHGQLIWIDALCIDQSNVAEKNRQVPLMGRIFSHATKVLCWLHGGSTTTLRDRNWKWIETMEYNDFPDHADLIAYDLLRFSRHSYWSRLWIVQELQLGQQIEVHWEGHTITGDRLTYIMDIEVLEQSGILQAAETQDIEGTIILRSLLSRRDAFLVGETHEADLFQLVIKYGNLLGSLLQDRVYALLALASNGTGFAVDYSESSTTLLVRLLHHCEVIPDWQEILEVAQSLNVKSDGADFRILSLCPQSNAATRLHAERTFQRCSHCFQQQDAGSYPDLIIGIPNIIYFGLTNSYTMFGPKLLRRKDFVVDSPESHSGIAHTYSVSAVLNHQRAPRVLDSGQLHLDDFTLMKQSLSHFTFAVSDDGANVRFAGTMPNLLKLLTSTKQSGALGRSCRWITCAEVDLEPNSQTICEHLLRCHSQIREVGNNHTALSNVSETSAVPRVVKWKEILCSKKMLFLTHFVLIENQQVRTMQEIDSVMQEYLLLRADMSPNPRS